MKVSLILAIASVAMIAVSANEVPQPVGAESADAKAKGADSQVVAQLEADLGLKDAPNRITESAWGPLAYDPEDLDAEEESEVDAMRNKKHKKHKPRRYKHGKHHKHKGRKHRRRKHKKNGCCVKYVTVTNTPTCPKPTAVLF
ncbi:hypothetical protein BGW41_006673 [Actinomortierella wolfii]|nr:hypothetical protein BGW41_006673 [Actinomortierella wolfii]